MPLDKTQWLKRERAYHKNELTNLMYWLGRIEEEVCRTDYEPTNRRLRMLKDLQSRVQRVWATFNAEMAPGSVPPRSPHG